MSSIIYNLFATPESESPARSMRNMMISGAEDDGFLLTYADMLKLQLNKNRTLIMIRDSVTAVKHSRARGLIIPYGRRFYEINLTPTGGDIDVLSAFGTAAKKAKFIETLFTYVCELSPLLRNRVYTFYYYAIDTFDRLGTPYSLADLMAIDIELVIDAVNMSTLGPVDKGRRLRFLEDDKMYESFAEFDSYIIQLESAGIVRVLSGEKTCADVLGGGSVCVVTGFAGEDKGTREILLNAMLYALNAYIERSARSHPVSVVLDGMDCLKGDLAKTLLEYNDGMDCVTYALVNDISKYVMTYGNELLEHVNSFLVFNQGSTANAEFWSGFFGSREVQESHIGFGVKKGGFGPFGGPWGVGVVPAPHKKGDMHIGFQKVNKPIYPPATFQELRPYQVMCYRRVPLLRKKERIEV